MRREKHASPKSQQVVRGKYKHLVKSVDERLLIEKRRRAAAKMDLSRKKTIGVRFDSVKEIRKMRDAG